MAANARDGKNRRFMLVQLPEQTYEIKKGKEAGTSSGKNAFKAGYRSIDAIARERIRRVESQSMTKQKPVWIVGSKLITLHHHGNPFPNEPQDQENQLMAFAQHVDNPLREDWSGKALMTECLLKLDEPVPHHITEHSIVGHQMDLHGKKTYFGVFDHEFTTELLSDLRIYLPSSTNSLHVISLDRLASDSMQQMTLQGDTNDLHFYLV